MTDEDGREDVAGAGEMHGNLIVAELEIVVVCGVVAHHRGLPVDGNARDKHAFRADLPQAVDELPGLVLVHATGPVGCAGEVAGFGEVGIAQVGHGEHLLHAVDGVGRDAGVELSLVAHDGVHVDGGAVCVLLLTVVGHDVGLLFRHDEACGDGVEVESQLFPHGKHTFYIFGGVENVEFAIVEGVAHECRGQVVGGEPEVGEDGEHGRRSHLAIACHVVDEEYLFFIHR